MIENAVIILLIKSFLYCNIHNKYLLFMFDMDRGKNWNNCGFVTTIIILSCDLLTSYVYNDKTNYNSTLINIPLRGNLWLTLYFKKMVVSVAWVISKPGSRSLYSQSRYYNFFENFTDHNQFCMVGNHAKGKQKLMLGFGAYLKCNLAKDQNICISVHNLCVK